ncbi:aldo/keto reductase, partial [Singulisphaera rosea]
EVDRSPAQVALAWLRQRPTPVIPIIGARRLDQFKDNLACLDLKLETSQVERLDSASRIELGFPHDFYAKEFPKAIIYGGLRDKLDV